jgi:hypothetical protein
MWSSIRNSLICISLITTVPLSHANPVQVLKSLKSKNIGVVSELENSINKKYNNNAEEQKKIIVGVGVAAIEKALNSGQTISIATGLTESETLKLSRAFPNQLKQTIFVLSQAGFKCQMDLYKQQLSPAKKSLGILLKDETLVLYPYIKNYAEQLDITVATWQIRLSETLSDGLQHLMKQQDVLLLLAQTEFNQSPQLSVIVQQAELLNKTLLASSEAQINSGMTKGCIIKTKDWINTVLYIIEKIYKNQQITPNYQLYDELAKYKVVMPSITVLN